MYLVKLFVDNFRGIKKSTIQLDQHCVILGPNNSGKSTIIDAIGLLLGKDKLVRNLGDYDFFEGDPKPTDRVKIKGTIIGFDTNDFTKYPEWFDDKIAPKWYNPKDDIVIGGDYQDGYILAMEIAFCARFDDDELEYPYIRYFLESDQDPFEEENDLKKINSHQLKELGFFLLPSNRSWDKMISFGSELFKKVIKFQDAIPAESIKKLRERLRHLEETEKIEKEDPLKIIIERINNELSGFTGKSDANMNFLPTTGDIEGILYSLVPFLQGNKSTNLPIGKHGSGIISLQTLLLLLEFGKFRFDNKQNFILAAEEPELHLQPSLHRRLVHRIRGLSTQSIITTHSPEIAAYFKPNEIIILKNNDGELSTFHLLSGEMPDKNALMKLFTVYRAEICEALMSNKVLVPEGVIDYRWINLLMNISITSEGWDFYNKDIPFTNSIGILPTSDAHVLTTYEMFSKLINKLIPIVDGDEAGNEYIEKLKSLGNPPELILQLPAGKDIEDLIAWILKPANNVEYAELSAILEKTIVDESSLEAALEAQKTRWDKHEEIVDYISRNKPSFRKTQDFINSISEIDKLSEQLSPYWEVDQSRSNEKTKIMVFKFL